VRKGGIWVEKDLYMMMQVQFGSSCIEEIRLAHYDLRNSKSSSIEVHTKLVAKRLVFVFIVLF
jgi:hypothetical protein